MFEEAFEAFRQFMIIDEKASIYVEELDHVYKTSGYEGSVIWLIENMDKWTSQDYNYPIYRSWAYARMGNKDKAFEELEKAYEARSPYIISIGVEPAFDTLRSDLRFDELLKKIGLKE